MFRMREDFAIYPFITMIVVLLSLVMMVGCEESINDEDVNNNRYTAEEDFYYKLGADNRTSFHLYAINGTVEIIGIPDLDSVEVSGTRRVESESIDDAKEYLPHLFIDIDQNPTTIRVETEQPNQTNGRNYTVSYEIRVPRDWKIYAEQANGDIEIQSINNDVIVDIVNGNANLRFINGDVDAQSDNGTVYINDVYGSVEASTINGSVNADIVLYGNDICSLSTVNGNVDLEIPVSTSAEFQSNVTNGNIYINGLTLYNQSTSNTSISGRLGNGDGNITLNAVNGNINVGI